MLSWPTTRMLNEQHVGLVGHDSAIQHLSSFRDNKLSHFSLYFLSVNKPVIPTAQPPSRAWVNGRFEIGRARRQPPAHAPADIKHN